MAKDNMMTKKDLKKLNKIFRRKHIRVTNKRSVCNCGALLTFVNNKCLCSICHSAYSYLGTIDGMTFYKYDGIWMTWSDFVDRFGDVDVLPV